MDFCHRIGIWWQDGHPVVPDRWCRNPDESLNWLGDALNLWHSKTRWFRWSWWSYVLSPREKGAWRASWLGTAWCRATGHRGQVFYNPGGLEPDNSCRGCGEEIA